ncbi:MAG: transposase [Planctomycetes bacterium]|nr:transposase [Planctomycetota bacterium]
MPKTHRPYAAEFRRRIVDLARSGRGVEKLASEFGISAQSVRNWTRQADLDSGRRQDGLTSEERKELQRLRREVRVLREERDILKKAAAWFAKETTSVPRRDSNS